MKIILNKKTYEVSGTIPWRERAGAYRIRNGRGDYFAQLVRGREYSDQFGERFEDDSPSRARPNGRAWRVEIRLAASGELVRHAGIFPSFDDASRDAIGVLRRDYGA